MAQMMVRPSGPKNAKIMIVGDAAHEMCLRRGEPFIGGGGFELTKMLSDVGIRRDDCYMTLVLKSRSYPNELNIIDKKKDRQPNHVFFQGHYITQKLYDACMQLREEVELVKPNVICTVGDLALFALTGVTSSFNYRSSIMDSVLTPGYKVIPTLRSDIIHTQYARRPWILHDLKRVKTNSLTPGLFHRDYKLLIAVDNSDQWFETMRDALHDLRDKVANSKEPPFPVSCDIETRGGHITCISFAWSPTEALCIQLSPLRKPEGFWTTEQESVLVSWMLQILMFPRVLLVGQNFNYDLQYIFRHWGILPTNVADTMLMQHSAFSNLPKNLGFLSSMYCEDHLYWKDDRTDWKEGEDGEDEMKYWEYCATDSCRTLAVYHTLKSVLKAMGLEKVNEFQQRLRPKVLKSMIRGVRVDQQKRSDLSLTLMREVESRKHWMREVVGYEINYRSPMQMQDFFYRQMGLKPITNRATGGITTNDAALQSLGAKEPILWPVIRKISELRSLGVFHSTFVLAPLDNDRRMRCSFNIAGTETYRFSSSKNAFGSGMNMQNIPKGGETEDAGLDLPNIRNIFIPDEGQTFFDIDLDSADLRIVTWESGCEWMKENFKAGRKPYVEVMKEYYHDQTMSKNSHPREYAMFKSLCHGTNYLGTAEGIAPRIGLNVHETDRIQKWYFGLCPEIAKWQSDVKKQVSGRRYVENAFGYRNYFFDKIEGTIFNQAIAWIPQSSVACLINRAYVAIDDLHGDWIQILLQVHDSLAGTFPSSRKEEALKLIREAASIAIPYEDPLYIPVGVVSSDKSWGECG